MFRVLVLVFFCMVGADMIVSLYKYKKRRASIYSVYCTMGIVCSVLLMVIPILLKSTFGFSFVFFQTDMGKTIGVIHIGIMLFIISYPAYRYNKYLNSDKINAISEKNELSIFSQIAIERLSWIWIPGLLFIIVGCVMLIQYL